VRTTVIPEKFEKSNAIKILGSTIDISATKNFENTILEKNKELVKINGELDQFVYSVSHDLRSPLLSIKGILSVMETAQNDEERNMYLSLIDKSVNRLDGTILEIIDFSRNARLEVVYSEFNIRELIENIFSDLAYVTNDPVILNMDIEGTDIVEMDKSRVEILLKNLISNGIKYRRRATEGSFVKVSVRSVEDDYHIIVSDNGEGISEENKQKVFEMFYRASSASSGTGLGLYICKDIVEKMKGTLHLNSQSGVGTEISLILPKRIVHEPLPVN
jgi:signal transduction histidine kinase